MSFYDAIRVGASGAADFEVERSLRFNDDDNAYLNKTFSGAGNSKTFTVSFWFKMGLIPDSASMNAIGTGVNNQNDFMIGFSYDGSRSLFLHVLARNSSSTVVHVSTNRKFRDLSAWYHVVISVDTTQSTNSDRVKIYINGSQETSLSNSTYPSQNTDLRFNSANAHYVGTTRDDQTSSGNFDGYMAEVNSIDGLALTPSSFAETNAATGQWNPKKYVGSYGTNGFYLKFVNLDLFTRFTDTSSSARTVTRNGNVIHKSDQNKNGATSIYFDGSGDSLTVPDSSDFHVAGNDFTIEAYIRRTSQGNDEWFLVQTEGTTSNTSIGLHIGSSSSGYANLPSLRYTVGGSGNELTGTTALAANTWYHIAGVRDGNTLRIYVNGQQENSTSFSGTITDASTPVIMGAVNSAGSAGLTGYLDQIRWSNSCRYTGGSTFTPPTTQFTADSNTMLLVQSNVTGDLGSDSSDNGNNFTPNNLAVSDAVKDTPTNNFCVLNQNDNNLSEASPHFVYSEGNLKVAWSFSGTNFDRAYGTLFIEPSDTNKYYWEATGTQNNEQMQWGVVATDTAAYRANNRNTNPSKEANIAIAMWQPYTDNGIYAIDNSGSSYGDKLTLSNGAPANGDIFSFVYDAAAGKFYVFFKGVEPTGQNYSAGTTLFDTLDTSKTYAVHNLQGDGGTSTKSGNFVMNWGQDSSFAGAHTAQGNTDAAGIGDFYYSVPSGAKALCSANLPDPTIPLPNKYFDTLLYTGNGSGQTLSGLNFSPDWLWIKSRSSTEPHELNDQVRGTLKSLSSNLNAAENTASGRITAFTSDGFTVGNSGNVNSNSENFVAWNWDAGETDGATYRVVVVSDSGNKYRFRNSANTSTFAQSAVTLNLAEGGTYIFNMDDSTNASHPFSIGTAANGTVYTSGITYFLDGVSKTYSEYTSGFASATTRRLHITVPASAPVLYYWCSVHSGMGGQINTNSTLGSSNFDGSIHSTAKASTTAGFSITAYPGNGSNAQTVGHGLGVAPDVIILKARAAVQNWRVWHHKLAADGSKRLILDQNNVMEDAGFLNDTAPTSTIFTLGNSDDAWNANGGTYIAYLFSEVVGYSKFGSYVGNGIADGTFVFTGFRPAFIIFKNISTATNWEIYDTKREPHNIALRNLYANLNNVEEPHATLPALDILSNGFKPRSTWDEFNKNGDTIVYFAFAESPFKNSRAR